MTICNTLDSFNNAISCFPKNCKIGFVPTMGALHQGHISLVQKAMEYSNHIVVSIFVNPTQFNNSNDLASYPRTIQKDCEKLEAAGVSIVFIPSVQEIYPTKDNRTFNLAGLDKTGEGPGRPGHFNGVVQVVSRLFDIVKPSYAFFGEKDFQQLAIIKHITKDLNYPIEIIACSTMRENDGLAMSSRNLLLNSQQRAAAPLIYRTLVQAAQKVKEQSPTAQNLFEPSELANWVTSQINRNPLFTVEYAQIVDSKSLSLLESWSDSNSVQLYVAVQTGPVRLIDNIKLK